MCSGRPQTVLFTSLISTTSTDEFGQSINGRKVCAREDRLLYRTCRDGGGFVESRCGKGAAAEWNLCVQDGRGVSGVVLILLLDLVGRLQSFLLFFACLEHALVLILASVLDYLFLFFVLCIVLRGAVFGVRASTSSSTVTTSIAYCAGSKDVSHPLPALSSCFCLCRPIPTETIITWFSCPGMW